MRFRAWSVGEVLLIAVVAFFVSSPCAMAQQQADVKPVVKVLIVSGEDYQGHHWEETGPVLRKLLDEDPQIQARLVEDFNFLASDAIFGYDVIVLHFKNYQPADKPEQVYANLRRFVDEKGGGLVLTHFACGAFQEWPEFVDLVGRVWNPELRGHDPYGEFTVEPVDSEHPAIDGIDAFEVTDELYTCADGQPKIEVLMQAKSKVDAKKYPIVFTVPKSKGRVCQSLLGHDAKVYQVPAVEDLMRRMVVWASGKTLE